MKTLLAVILLLAFVGKAVAAEFITVEVPVDNYFAFKVLHDDDANNRVTKNWTGIWPREGLGFSNGVKIGAFGPPGFDGAKVSKDVALQGIIIKIVYP